MRNVLIVFLLIALGACGCFIFFNSPPAHTPVAQVPAQPMTPEPMPPPPPVEVKETPPPEEAPAEPVVAAPFVSYKARILQEFCLTPPTNNVAMLTLTNGRVLIARSCKREGSHYVASVAMNDRRSIYAVQCLPTQTVTAVSFESHEDIRWRCIQRDGRPSDARDPQYHAQVIELVHDGFSAAYPASSRRKDLALIREQWLKELAQLSNGWTKADGKWYEPGVVPPKTISTATRCALLDLEAAIRQQDFSRAVKICQAIRIPADFPEARQSYTCQLAQLGNALAAQLAKTRTTSQQAENALSRKFDKQLAIINARKMPGLVAMAKSYAESQGAYDSRKNAKRDEIRQKFDAKQNTERKKLRKDCDAALEQVRTQAEKQIRTLTALRETIQQLEQTRRGG